MPRHRPFTLLLHLSRARLSTCSSLRAVAIPTASSISADQSALPPAAPQHARPTAPLSQSQRQYLERALRVNQAGELAATLIYTAQTPLVTRSHPHLRPLMQHMHDQEAGHLATFNALLAKHRVRPTAFIPLWHVAAGALGWSTAWLGREAAMACTEAVETEIGEHYNGQIRELLSWTREAQDRGEDMGEELKTFVEDIRRIRDEELEHLDHAVEEDAKKSEGYPVLTAVVRAGCRGAIWLSERY